MIELNIFEKEDVIFLQFIPRVPVEYPSIVDINLENITVTLFNGQNVLRIDHLDQWAQLWFAPVFSHLLIEIGLYPFYTDMAYDITNRIWVKNEYGITWTLEYNEDNNT